MTRDRPRRRAEDRGVLCRVATILTLGWDFIDKRDIDKHAMAWATFWITWTLVDWALEFVFQHPEKPGIEVAAIVGAIMLPWTPLQGVVIKWYFDARRNT